MSHTLLRPHWRPTHDATPHGFDRWIAPDGSDAWVKILNPDGHLCQQVWAAAPEAKLCLRLHGLSEEKAQMRSDPVGTARRHAQEWLSFVTTHGLTGKLDQLAFEGINEPSWEPSNLPPVVAYNAAFVEFMGTRGMSPCALQINTGWPTNHSIRNAPPDWEPFEPVRLALLRYGGYLSVHEYWDRRGPASDDWLWNPGRIFQIPDNWAAIPVLVTEAGYDQAVNAPAGTPNHGWQGHLSADEYMAHLTEYDRRLRHAVVDYPAKPKVQAVFVFTHDFDHPWDTFDTRPLTERLCLHAQWVRQQPEITPLLTTPTLPPVCLPDTGVGYVDAPAGLNVRSGPSTSAAITRRLSDGEPVVWDDKEGDWLRLRTGEWVHGGYVRQGDTEIGEPPTTQPSDDNWSRCLAFVLKWEGGWADNPADPGGATMRGITLATYTRWRQAKGQSVPTKEDLRHISDTEVAQIYHDWYWVASKSDQLPWPLCLANFDTAVNAGVGRAQEMLEKSNGDFLAYMGHLIDWYTRINNFEVFGRAWIRRRADIMLEAAK